MTEFTHEIVLTGDIEQIFPLFTPQGEEAWVPGWSPTYLTGKDTREEMLFTTGEGAEKTFWTCLKWQPESHHARYLRITPASRIAIVDVQCRAAEKGTVTVQVTYSYTPLTRSAANELADMTQQEFAASIGEWATLISGYLSS
ncbi:MAG TPA: SRPBCC family protein [Rhodobacteraceae bacterium]|nr:SRPBCC family protein [Paracoccaceae bacterium]